MDDFAKNLFHTLNGQPYDEAIRTPKLSDLTHKHELQLFSKRPQELVYLGHSAEKDEYLTREDRDHHIHILGATQQGKSRLLTHLLTQDLKHGYPACLIDGGENGATAKAVLNWCIANDFKKVCYINPIDFLEYDRVPTIQPLKYGEASRLSAGSLLTAFGILWDNPDPVTTPRIERFVEAIITVLHRAGLTLDEARYFLATRFKDQRQAIFELAHLPTDDDRRVDLEDVHRPPAIINQAFQSSVNRLQLALRDDLLRLVLGSKKTDIPFERMVREGWLILVNLDHQGVWNRTLPAKALGTIIISQLVNVIHEFDRLNTWSGRYYLYIDEVGKFATDNLHDILDYKSKLSLKLCVAHQRFKQIKNEQVRDAIETNAHNKFLFYTAQYEDRIRMMKLMGFGGDLPDRQIDYELSQTEQRAAYIRINKKNPVKVTLLDVPDIEVDNYQFIAFKKELYSQEWFHTPEEINHEINARFRAPTEEYQQSDAYGADSGPAAPRADKNVPHRRTKNDSESTRKAGPRTAAKRKPVKSIFSEET